MVTGSATKTQVIFVKADHASSQGKTNSRIQGREYGIFAGFLKRS